MVKKRQSVVCYCQHEDELSPRLIQTINDLAVGTKIESFGSLEALAQRLRQPPYLTAAVVLSAVDRDDLEGLISLSPLLSGLKTIIILPDNQGSTLARGLKLRPSFFTTRESDLADIREVMKKILSN